MNDMRLVDADEMAVNESEAYMKVNAREDVSPITQGINSVVHRKIQELIANTPTIDAVPVVRCRECKWQHTLDCPMNYEVATYHEYDGHCTYLGSNACNDDGFCWCGDREDCE